MTKTTINIWVYPADDTELEESYNLDPLKLEVEHIPTLGSLLQLVLIPKSSGDSVNERAFFTVVEVVACYDELEDERLSYYIDARSKDLTEEDLDEYLFQPSLRGVL